MQPDYLELRALTKNFGQTVAVDQLDLKVSRGELIVLLGPSGCGKTTTLRMVAGFEQASSGNIFLDGRAIVTEPPYRRDIGMVFQNYALFPHMTVGENVAFGLEMRKESASSIKARVEETLGLVQLNHLRDRLPRNLSGGQQQRVALARALAIRPKLLLLDEPLSNLDANLRHSVAREIRLLQRDQNLTTLMVTHDQEEAMAMADRLVVMKDGALQQAGSQSDLYDHPQNQFISQFVGQSNLFVGNLSSDNVLQVGADAIRLRNNYGYEGRAALALRPERLKIDAADAGKPHTLRGTVVLATYLGAQIEYVVRVSDDITVLVRSSSDEGDRSFFKTDEPVAISWSASTERVFNEQDVPLRASTETISEAAAQ